MKTVAAEIIKHMSDQFFADSEGLPFAEKQRGSQFPDCNPKECVCVLGVMVKSMTVSVQRLQSQRMCV